MIPGRVLGLMQEGDCSQSGNGYVSEAVAKISTRKKRSVDEKDGDLPDNYFTY